ncbi:MAG: helix-turn-helix domain-containing protein [Candidatus Gastranaerophilales bacterium]
MFLEKRKGNIIGKLRAKQLSQKKLAKKLKLSESYITRLINGERYNKVFESFIYYHLGIDYKDLL